MNRKKDNNTKNHLLKMMLILRFQYSKDLLVEDLSYKHKINLNYILN